MPPRASYLDIYSSEGTYINTVYDYNLNQSDPTIAQILATSVCTSNGITGLSATQWWTQLASDTTVSNAWFSSDWDNLVWYAIVAEPEIVTGFFLDWQEYKIWGWHSTITVTLTSAWWSSKSQTVSVTGVTASNTVIVSPAPSSIEDYADWGVYCSAQGSGTLTFTCSDTPSSDITVNVLIIS